MTRGSVPATLNLLHRPRCIYICFPFIRETHNEHPRGVCECVRVRDGLTWRDQGADDDKETVLWDLSVCEEQDCGNVFYPRLHVQSGQIHLGALQERLLLKLTIWTAYQMWPLLSWSWVYFQSFISWWFHSLTWFYSDQDYIWTSCSWHDDRMILCRKQQQISDNSRCEWFEHVLQTCKRCDLKSDSWHLFLTPV